MAIASRLRFEGSIDGTPFEGGTGEDVPLVLGAGQFIPGFEEHLVGLKAGESKTFNVKFPDDYPATAVAGKEATFAVTVKAVEAPGAVTIDDEFAKTLGLGVARQSCKDAVKERIAREHAAASRQKLKRALLDQLDERHKFEPPPSLVEQEFNNVWSQIENDLKQQNRTFADEGTTEEKARDGISRHRRAARAARSGHCRDRREEQYQGDRRAADRGRSWSRCGKFPARSSRSGTITARIPNALAALRAPLFEDKVVDFLIELAEVTDKPVSRDELFKEDEE